MSEHDDRPPGRSQSEPLMMSGQRAAVHPRPLASPPPPPTTIEDLAREVRKTNQLLTAHIEDQAKDRERIERRFDTILELLKEALGRK